LHNVDVAQWICHHRSVTVFAGLADPTRLRIIELLREHEELPAGQIAEYFEITRAGVSRHLRSLEDAGFVTVRLEAQRRMYRLNPGPFAQIDAWLGRYRQFWGSKFDALRRHVGEET
jgi:DNA-binding transcriptional ArsR family regulator